MPSTTFRFLEEKLFSIQISPGVQVQVELERYALECGVSVTYQARYALTLYRESSATRDEQAKDNMAWYVWNLRPPKSKLSREERNEITLRLNREVSERMIAGTLGNLLLPQELHEFVKRNVESGEFASSTDVLTAVMPFLRAQRGKSLRAEIVDEERYVLFGWRSAWAPANDRSFFDQSAGQNLRPVGLIAVREPENIVGIMVGPHRRMAIEIVETVHGLSASFRSPAQCNSRDFARHNDGAEPDEEEAEF